jgi:hypothetical protein
MDCVDDLAVKAVGRQFPDVGYWPANWSSYQQIHPNH